MKVFITGGSGFIGQRVVRQLVANGHDVYGLTRSGKGAAILEDLGATAILGDVLDRRSMRIGMSGSDCVIHMGAMNRLGEQNWRQMEVVNVSGTRNVLELALDLSIPKIIYTSTVSVFGDTQGITYDETAKPEIPDQSHFARTKWLAHYDVVLPMIEAGAPITILMPGLGYGPGDPGLIGELMSRFYANRFPFPMLPGPDTVVTFAHVDDIADGIILGMEKGKIGESYILAGPAISFGEIVDFWSRMTGRPKPVIRVNGSLLRPLVPIFDSLAAFAPLSSVFTGEAVGSLGGTFAASGQKAIEELGWKNRSIQAGMLDTFNAISMDADGRPDKPLHTKNLVKIGIALAVLVLLYRLIFRNKPKSEE
ncbi:MAG: NAD-dependent epimerase/dehydratase family protein [Anaerolineae bacterium]